MGSSFEKLIQPKDYEPLLSVREKEAAIKLIINEHSITINNQEAKK